MIKFIHTGDLHLGSVFENASFPADVAKLRREELFKTFNNIIKAAVSLKDNFLLICGDLFEEKFCTAHDIKRVFDTLAALTDIEVLIIAGNHDLYSSAYRHYANKYPNIHIFGHKKIEKKSFEKFNTDIYAISWDKAAYYAEPDFSSIELDENKINILMLHADCAPNSTYMPINIKAISDIGFDYIALGHIHKPRHVTGRAYYCGSCEPLDFKETGEHGIYHIEADKDAFKIDFVKLASRNFVVNKVNITPDMGYLDILRALTANISHESLNNDMHRLAISGMVNSTINLDEIIAQAKPSFFYMEYSNDTIPDFDIDYIKQQNENNIIGKFIEKMQQYDMTDERYRRALYKGLALLLSEGDK